MTPRERMIRAFEFADPDRFPTVYHPSTAGLYVHGKKLLDLLAAYPPDNPIRFDSIPQPPPETLDSRGEYHEFKKDEFGTTWEYRVFGIAGHPWRYPIEAWDSPYEFPAVPATSGPAFEEARKRLAEEQRTYLVFGASISLLEKLHHLRPFEEVLMDLADEKPSLLAFLDRLVDYQRRQIAYHLALGADVISFGDDWGAQQSLLMPPALFRRIFKPRLRELMAPIRAAGRRIFYHSCGAIHPLYGDLVEIGINGLWHQIALYPAEEFAREAARNRTLLFLHMDRQHLVPLGTPREIAETVKRYADIHRALGGGAMFYVEIENDAPFENVEALVTSIHKYG